MAAGEFRTADGYADLAVGVTTPEGEAASMDHVGAYAGLGATYQRLSGAIAAMGRKQAGPFW